MILRAYTASDLQELLRLFYDTVRTVNAEDYSAEQLAAWMDDAAEREARWAQSLAANETLVAIDANGAMLGFADMDATGYLDHLYVHKHHQRQGIATALCNALEERARVCGLDSVSTHASITAKPFFMQRGYYITKEQQVILGTISLTNYVMEKRME